MNRQILIPVAAVAVVAIVVIGLWLLLPRFHTATPVQTQIKIAELVEQNFRLEQTIDATEAPSAVSASLIRLRSGIVVKVIGIVQGGSWLQIQLPDNRIAYVPVAAIPAVNGPGPPDPAAQAASAIEFDPTAERWKVTTQSPAFSAPDVTARQLYPVEAGRLVDIVAKSKDGKWAWVRTADDSPAYMQLASLTFIEAAKPAPSAAPSESAGEQTPPQSASAQPPPPAPAPPPLPEEVSGRAQAITTSLLVVDGQRVSLAGLRGQGGEYRDQFQSLINAKGGTMTCHRHGHQFTCQFPDGNDVGRAVLYNGGARLGRGASQDYREQAKAAQDGHRGIWQ